MTELAAVVLAHGDPVHLRRLVGALDDVPVFLHCDAKTEPEVFAAMTRGLPRRVTVCERISTKLASWSLVHAELTALREAVARTRAHHIAVMSGSDYPLVSMQALLDGLVCIYALAQILALFARERRRAVAVIRALGASRIQVFAVFAGAALLLCALALPVGIVLERTLLGPAVAGLAVSYGTLSLGAGGAAIAVVVAGVGVAAALAAAWATRTATATAIVGALRED